MKNDAVERGVRLSRAIGALVLFMASGVAYAQIAIESVVGLVQGGTEAVKIDLSDALSSVPTGFAIQSPARIALDFPGVTNAMGRSSVEVNQGNLKSITVVQAGERTRVVLNLKAAATYKAQLQGKSLLVLLDQPVQSAAEPNSPTVFAEVRAKDNAPLRDMDFRRTNDGAGRLIVTLPNNQVGVDIRQLGQNLVVEFKKATLPEGLRRRMDVGDFGTPIKTVTTTQQGDRVRVLIEPRGQWEHSAYQSDEQFVVEVKEVRDDPKKLTQGVGYNGQKLSLNFQNIEVRALLQVIADFTNFNIVTSDSVTGSVTLRLQDVPWDQALDIILQAKGLGMRKSGNVLWVAPKDEIAAKEKLDLEAQAAVQSLEPLRTQSFQINYAKAADIATQLTSSGSGGGASSNARLLSSRGSVISEPRTNQIFVTDIPSKLEQVQALIAKLDIAVPQVMIEARIVEASDTFAKALGVKLGGRPVTTSTASEGANVGTTYSNALGAAGVSGATYDNLSQFVNLPATGATGTFAIALFGAGADRFLGLEISAMESDGKGKVVSSPRVVTADKNKALIEQGTEFPYQVASASGATSIAFRKASLKLEVTPQITPEGNIILNLDVNKDTRGIQTTAGYAIDTKHIQTQVLVDNGGTVVIGGIFTEDQVNTVDKVPFFGDLPGIGALFRRNSTSQEKREMLVFITPKVLGDVKGTR
ncbi:type IV pilus secretin PilQ [Curvibacter sp. APW13]|uniref:type IV pilus secretin PilQ n=1 Tax=Curvibacter sp. APW13 TaxID=3077236 RepID=UPI0028DDFA69|nr:type IV pilus secretin PilQ [Curvibacter sp. APW13]MDT8989587.1 type IV pilus secretin PilQ [Curvibacter sp. APW13]